MNQKISLRAQNTPFSPIRKFVPLLEEVKKKGIYVYEIHIGQPDLPTPKEIIEGIKGFNKERLTYTPSAGIAELRKAWQEYFHNFGIKFDLSDIVATIGGSEAIFFSFLTACSPGEEIITFEPFYTTYNSYAAMTNVQLVPVRTTAETSFHLPEKEEIEKKITAKTRAILICNPNNPTGTVYRKDEIENIITLAQRHDLFIIADETYREFTYDGEKHYSVMSFEGAWERTILLDSVSKGLSACGARIGCLASKNKDVISAINRFAQARLSLPMVEQEAVIPSLKNSLAYTERIVKEYEKRRDAVWEELQKIEGVSCLKPKGAFYLIAKLPVKDSEHFTEWMLGKFSFENETVMVSPASGFYATQSLGKDEVRIAFVLSAEKLKRAVMILGKALVDYNKNFN